MKEVRLLDFDKMEDEYCNRIVEIDDDDTDYSLDLEYDKILPRKHMKLEPNTHQIDVFGEDDFAFVTDESVVKDGVFSFSSTCDIETDEGEKGDMQHFIKDIEDSLEDMNIEAKPENESGYQTMLNCVEAEQKDKSSFLWNGVEVKPKDKRAKTKDKNAYLWNGVEAKPEDKSAKTKNKSAFLWNGVEVKPKDKRVKTKDKSAYPRNGVKAKPKNESAYLWNVIIQKDLDGDNLLFIAIILLNTNIACMLIDLAPSYKTLNDVNKLFQTALHLAALTGNYTVARRLLVAGAIVDKRDFRLNTALHTAVKKGYIKVAKNLMTPVTYLEAKKNSYEIPYQRIPQNLETFNVAGRTCLHIAARCKNKPMIDLLLSNEADINARDLKSGKTILHYFAEDDDVEMVKFIVSKSKLDLNVKTYYGVTAAELAYSKGHFAIAYLLLSSGTADEIVSVSYGDGDSGSDSDDSDSASV